MTTDDLGALAARIARLKRAGLAKGSGRPVNVERLRQLRPDDPEDSVLKNVLEDRESSW